MAPAEKRGVDAGSGVLQCDPNNDWYYMHAPGNNWRPSVHLEKTCWIPMLIRHVLAPGVNGVRTLRRGEEPQSAYKASVAKFRDEGYVHLDPSIDVPPEYLPEGVPAGGYVRTMPSRGQRSGRAGAYYFEAWDVPQRTNRNDEQKFVYDHPKHEAWCAWLVTSGQIVPPDEYTTSRIVAKSTRQLEHVEALEAAGTVSASSVKKREDALRIHEDAEVRALVPKIKPKPKRVRRTKRAK